MYLRPTAPSDQPPQGVGNRPEVSLPRCHSTPWVNAARGMERPRAQSVSLHCLGECRQSALQVQDHGRRRCFESRRARGLRSAHKATARVAAGAQSRRVHNRGTKQVSAQQGDKKQASAQGVAMPVRVAAGAPRPIPAAPRALHATPPARPQKRTRQGGGAARP
eukprot:932643-Prymnesium_polylepis.1